MVVNWKTHKATQDENAANKVRVIKHKNWKKIAGVAIAGATIFACGLISLHGNIAHADTISQLQQENQEYEEAMNGTYNESLLGPDAKKLLGPLEWAPGGFSNSANRKLTADEVMDWIYAQPALNLINKFRKEHGNLPPLKFSVDNSILAYRLAIQQADTTFSDKNEGYMGNYDFADVVGAAGNIYSSNLPTQDKNLNTQYLVNNHNSVIAQGLYEAMEDWIGEYPMYLKVQYDVAHHISIKNISPDSYGHIEILLTPGSNLSFGMNMYGNICEGLLTNVFGPDWPSKWESAPITSEQLGEINKQYQKVTNTGYITDRQFKPSECNIPTNVETFPNPSWKTYGGPKTFQQNVNAPGQYQQEVCGGAYTKADYQKMIQANDEKIDQLEGKDPKVSATKPVKKELDKDTQKAKKVADQKKEAKDQTKTQDATPDKATETKPKTVAAAPKPEPKAAPVTPAPATTPTPAESEPSSPASSNDSSSSSSDTQSTQSTPTYAPTASSSDSDSDSTPSYTPAPAQSTPAPSTTSNSGTYPVPQDNGQSTVTHTTPDTSVHTTNTGKPVSNPYGNGWKVTTHEYNASNSPLPQALW